ncbi:hypothetical protein [Streptomyces sp. I05A-00742]|uniref:hypothetical protein n=1 Tax=Streptomyces sp. I05A-00742 TaxID=2732853 RepID=UPI00148868DE|nr:hypothetical protein [Streptomyces sp. I05A-00742]
MTGHGPAGSRSQFQRGRTNIQAGNDLTIFQRPVRLFVAALLVAGAVVGAAYVITDKDPVDSYRKDVLATCQQVNDVLGADHNDMLVPNPAAGSFGVKKSLLLAYTRNNIDSARQSFALLNEKDPPDALRKEHAAAKRAQDAWLDQSEKTYRRYQREMRDVDSLDNVNRIGAGGMGPANTLNATMSGLAGQNCRVTGKGPGAGSGAGGTAGA